MMVNSIKDNGKIIKCMARASSNGQMVEFMKEAMLRIKRKDLEKLHGLTVGFMKECGKMDASMVRANTKAEMEIGEKECGKMGLV
jgi:hypothetical protein